MTENDEPLVVRLDHLVLTVRDPQATVRFYEAVLGMKPVRFGEERLALQFGNTKINLHQAGAEIAPYALRPTPGSADLCLITEGSLDAVRERLQFLCRTSDGFAVAKYDLETRGPGDFFGSAQHGLPTLRVADLVQDTRTLRVAQDEAKALLAEDPNLIDPAHQALSDEVERLFETAGAMN